MNEVVLFDGEISPGTSSRAVISTNESGDLVLSIQDVGAGPRQFWGDSDYEWWVTVKRAQSPELLERLGAEASADPLSLIGKKFGGRSSAPSDFRRWLEDQGITYEFFSYA